MLDLDEDWVWDFWTADDGERYHLFFLHAPRSLGDPDLRHTHASIGHAVSEDLSTWRRLDDALAPQPEPAYDDLATWTGSVVRGDDGLWRMFTSGIARAEGGRVQRIGVSTSPDLLAWSRVRDALPEADDRWYHLRPAGAEDRVADQHWRDPFVIRDAAGLWHLYLTAQVPPPDREGGGHGVVGHAVSTDLLDWQVTAPLSAPTGRFDQLEVISLAQLDGRWALLFSCLATEMPGAQAGAGGVWSVPVAGPGAPVDVGAAVRLTSEDLYVGRLVTRRDGTAVFLAFENRDAAGHFSGGVIDPVDVGWRSDGVGLELRGDAPSRWLSTERSTY